MDRSTISSIMRKKGQLEHGEERTDRYTDHIMDHGEKERKNQVDMARRLTHRQAETGRQIDRQTDIEIERNGRLATKCCLVPDDVYITRFDTFISA